MRERLWFNRDHPQTLQLAVMLLYLNGVLGLFGGFFVGGLGFVSLIFIVGMIAGAYGIANSYRWGYRLGIVAAVLQLAYSIFAIVVLAVVLKLVAIRAVGSGIVTLLFQAALVVALLHPQSRSYERIWFRAGDKRPYR